MRGNGRQSISLVGMLLLSWIKIRTEKNLLTLYGHVQKGMIMFVEVVSMQKMLSKSFTGRETKEKSFDGELLSS